MAGYSVETAKVVHSGDTSRLGVLLGIACIEAAYPVTKVARRLGVSRQAVYNWFYGLSEPSAERQEAVRGLIDEIR